VPDNRAVAAHDKPLREEDVDADPLKQFSAWFEDARSIGLRQPEAMAVATAARDGAPSVRMVLCKGFDRRGFVFFTNYGSRKARELETNPQAALLFHWEPLGRQVRIEGAVERVADEESVTYARSRPRASQISALASAQSRPIASRGVLEARVREIEREYAERELPRHEQWGGYRISPTIYEFWQHRSDRLHDRLQYCLTREGEWRMERLSP
jgi:pyridoxamine 5'-phosphate oxidase